LLGVIGSVLVVIPETPFLNKVFSIGSEFWDLANRMTRQPKY
jgi:uncharacterized membrane protein YbaN (DUF454 family)